MEDNLMVEEDLVEEKAIIVLFLLLVNFLLLFSTDNFSFITRLYPKIGGGLLDFALILDFENSRKISLYA